MKILYLGSNEKKKNKYGKRTRTRLKQDLLKGSRKWIVSTQNVKRKLNNLEQVQMEYWKMDIKKVNCFNFLNEEVE